MGMNSTIGAKWTHKYDPEVLDRLNEELVLKAKETQALTSPDFLPIPAMTYRHRWDDQSAEAEVRHGISRSAATTALARGWPGALGPMI